MAMTRVSFTTAPRLDALLERVEAVYRAGYFDSYADALRALNAADQNPTGDAGIWALGRCDRCGESFTPTSERAEVTKGTATDEPLPSLLIHVGCMSDTDVLA